MSEAVVKYTARDFKIPKRYRYSELSGEIFTIGQEAFAVTSKQVVETHFITSIDHVFETLMYELWESILGRMRFTR